MGSGCGKAKKITNKTRNQHVIYNTQEIAI